MSEALSCSPSEFAFSRTSETKTSAKTVCGAASLHYLNVSKSTLILVSLDFDRLAMAEHEKEQVFFMRGGGHYNKNSALQHLAIEGLFSHFPNLNTGTIN